jgi:predicted transcriptional regulator of viral defense system
MYLQQLLASKKTVFSLEDLGKIWKIEDKDYLKVVASRLFQRGVILRICRGFYALRETYDLSELANKLRSPSYVSLETVLQKNNVIFQDYGSTVFSVSNNTMSKQVASKAFQYYKLKETALSNPIGIVSVGQAIVATAERAVCDRIYFSPRYYFDNLRGLDMKKLSAISKIYENTRIEKEVEELIRNNK